MQVHIEIKFDPDSDLESEEEKYTRLVKEIYKKFPKALWERTDKSKEDMDYEIFI